jgi:ribosome-associated protein
MTLYPVMDSRKLARLCPELADNKKADDIVILDMQKLSSVADYFVIATGSSEPHLRAITEEIREKLREDHALRPRAVDGAVGASWVVLDYYDVVVHVMRTETRALYNLEGLWSDAPRVRLRKKPTTNAR